MIFPLDAVATRPASIARWYRRYATALASDRRAEDWGRRGLGVRLTKAPGHCVWCGEASAGVVNPYCSSRCKLNHHLRSWRVLRRMVLLRDGLVCNECGAPAGLAKGGGLEVDHIEALVDGGDDRPSNLITRCKSQHWKKSAAESKARARSWQGGLGAAVRSNCLTIVPRGTGARDG